MSFLDGYKTYIGLAISLIAWGATKLHITVDAAGLANDIAQAGGLAIAIYGRFVTHANMPKPGVTP